MQGLILLMFLWLGFYLGNEHLSSFEWYTVPIVVTYLILAVRISDTVGWLVEKWERE